MFRDEIDTCAGRDADKPGHHALHRADHRGLAEEDDVEAGPGQEARRGANVGVEHGDRRGYVGGVRRATVEAGPAEPEQPAAGDHEKDIVRREPLPVALQSRAHLSASRCHRHSGTGTDLLVTLLRTNVRFTQ